MASHAEKPPTKAHMVTWPIRAHSCIQELTKQLTEDPSEEATVALERLAKSERLVGWRLNLKDGLYQQKIIRRSKNLKPPSMEKVARSLANGPPANVPELWAGGNGGSARESGKGNS
ncbi:MAG: hypothetical protein OXI38_02820 [Bacteroidota bacterium]|nr:hypothetical protein [Bacteroidota bacterium]